MRLFLQLLIGIIFCIVPYLSRSQTFQDSKEFKDLNAKMIESYEASDSEATIRYADRILNQLDPKKSTKVFIRVSRIKAVCYLIEDKDLEGYRLLLEILPLCQQEDSETCKECEKVYRATAMVLGSVQDFNQAIGSLNRICPEERGRQYYYLLTSYYAANGDSLEAIQYSEDWIDLMRESEPNELIDAFTIASLNARTVGLYDQERAYIIKSIDVFSVHNLDSARYAYLFGNLGGSYLNSNDLDLAEDNLNISARYTEDYDNISGYVNTVLSLVQIDSAKGDLEKGAARLEYVLINYEHELKELKKIKVYRALKDIYKLLGRKDQYIAYSELWSKLYTERIKREFGNSNELKNEIKKNALKNLRERHEVEKRLKDEKLLNVRMKAKNEQSNLYLTISIVLLLLVSMAFFFWRYRIIQKKRDAEQTLKIAQVKHEKGVLRAKLEKEASQSRLLSLELLMKQEYAGQIVSKLKDIDELPKVRVREIESFIQSGLDIKSIEAELQGSLGDVSQQFVGALSKKHADLTDNDLKLASFVLMKMTNSEIAISRGISVNSVKQNKYRFKKKLGLEADEDLYGYLINQLGL